VPPSRGLFAALVVALLAVQAAVFFGLRAGETRLQFASAELAPSLEIYGDQTLLQTFVATADGLSAITVYPTAASGPATGTVELSLESGPGPAFARTTVPAAEFLARPAFTWTFPPIGGSARQPFALRVGLPAATEGHGLRLAIGPPSYVDGALSVGARAQWGDLRFETQSQHSRVVDLLQRRPAVRHGTWVPVAAGAGMIVLAVSLAAVTLGLIRDGDAG
jgi:hypothetical protein